MYDFSSGNLSSVFNDFFILVNKKQNYNYTRLDSRSSHSFPPVRTMGNSMSDFKVQKYGI